MLDLATEQFDTVRRILAHHVPAREVQAFGSRVSGRTWRYSDLDLVIVGAEPPPALTLARLLPDFEDCAVPFRVDVLEQRDMPEAGMSAFAQRSRAVSAPADSLAAKSRR